MNSYRSDSFRFPWIDHQSWEGHDVKVLMLSERSETWYSNAGPANAEYLNLIKPGYRVIDCGANEGVTAVLAALRAGPTGQVLAFEPAPHNHQPLEINCALNGVTDRVQSFWSALGENVGRVKFGGELVGNGEDEVVVTALDYWCDFAPDAIKVDLEGYEVKALRGAARLLERHKPIIFLEPHLGGNGGVDMRQFGDTPEQLVELMTGLGYEFFQDGRPMEGELPHGAVVLRHKEWEERVPVKLPKMFCLTLRADHLKMHRAQQEFARAGLQVEFYNGFDNRRGMLNASVMGRSGLYVAQPQVGCTLSHVALWEHLLHTDGDEFLIFEDDVLFGPDFFRSFEASYRELPADWQIVFIGSDQIEGKKVEKVSERIAHIEMPYGTHAYMVKKWTLPILLETNEIISANIDLQIGWESLPRLKHYAFVPSLVKQASAEAGIRKP